MAKFTRRTLQPDDPIFTGGPQVFTPIARPARQGGTVVQYPSAPSDEDRLLMREIEESTRHQSRKPPGSIVTVDLEMMGMTLEEYEAEQEEKVKKPRRR